MYGFINRKGDSDKDMVDCTCGSDDCTSLPQVITLKKRH